MTILRRFAPLLLVASLFLSALAVVSVKQRVRNLQADKQELATDRDRLDTEFNQLRLEQGAIAAHGRIEEQAHTRLKMQDPDDYSIVLVPAESR